MGAFFFDSWEEMLRKRLPLAEGNLEPLLKAFSSEYNPVVRYLVERHAPVHEALVTSPKTWKIICPRQDRWHVMAGPIVDRSHLVGAVGCTRERSMPAFDTQDLTDLSAICLHLSVWVATVRSQSVFVGKSQHPPFKSNRLTPRELEIAELVALGRTNAEIGSELWITKNSVKQALKRMFRKLGVSSRVEMVTRLSATSQINLSLNSNS
jgi:DNA-binding CsgD family transcriptional regulator